MKKAFPYVAAFFAAYLVSLELSNSGLTELRTHLSAVGHGLMFALALHVDPPGKKNG